MIDGKNPQGTKVAVISLDDARQRGLGEWPEPPDPIALSDDLLPVPAFDIDLLPDQWRPWLMDVADRMQAPPDFPAAASIVAAGGLIGRRIGIAPQERTDWIEVPNLWGGMVGRPSVMKTPTMSAAYAPVRSLEVKAADEHTSKMKDFLRAKEAFDLKKKAWTEANKRKARDAFKSGKEVEIEPFQEEAPQPPDRKRYLLEDATYEKAGEIMVSNPYGVSVVCDELVGFLKPLSRQENASARAFWLKAWNGKDVYLFDRIGRGTILTPCTASIFGAIQPAKLASFLRDATEGGEGDDGLLQRFQVLVYPDVSADWKDVDRYPKTSERQAYSFSLEGLVHIDPNSIGAADEVYGCTPHLRFCRESLRVFQDWRERHEEGLRKGDLHPALESHFAKYRTLVPALALICHLVDNPAGGPVSRFATERAIAWSEYLSAHARRIYGAVTLTERTNARTIWKRLSSGNSLREVFSVRDIQQKGWAGLGTADVIREALDVLLDHELVQARETPTTVRGGRPGEEFRMNPKAMNS